MRHLFALGLAALLAIGPTVCAAPDAAPADKVMVAAANPAAVEAGLKVLRAGGSAADAAVAVQVALGLVEPQSSGLGGGAFLVYYDAKAKKATAYDGRETAPAGAMADMFLKPDGTPLPFSDAVLSGRSAGVPGAIAMLALAQHEHGKVAWSSLFEDTAKLAEGGFTVGPRMAKLLTSGAAQTKAPDVIAYFSRPGGGFVQPGDQIKNPAYAATLRKIAAQGAAALLSGPIAADIVARIHQEPMPGTMSLADLAAYRPHEAPALCRPYRAWLVCEPNAPSGGPATLVGLGILEHTDIATRGPTDPRAWFELAQAERLMYADDLRYVGDPAFVQVPLAGLLDPAYLDQRAKLIGDKAGPAPAPGHPAGAPIFGPDATKEPGGTSSFAIVDRWGDVAVMTTTVESLFGDGRMVDGFLLNNQLTDFSFSPRDKDGTPAANAVAAGKRPRSSMAPTLVLDRDGHFVAAVGSPGGLAIPSYVLKALVGVLDWKLSMQDAINLPNLIALGDAYISEPAKFAPGVVETLAQQGVTLRGGYGAEASGLHGVIMRDGHLEGGADPRREGIAAGY
jgi:gamma-glutamyltranspeptidase/glutathione hydrolase